MPWIRASKGASFPVLFYSFATNCPVLNLAMLLPARAYTTLSSETHSGISDRFSPLCCYASATRSPGYEGTGTVLWYGAVPASHGASTAVPASTSTVVPATLRSYGCRFSKESGGASTRLRCGCATEASGR
eukprot:2886838-Rhodomonas_salina.1